MLPMTQLSLKDRLACLLREHFQGRFVASGDLQRIVAKTDYRPQNVGRRLRELANEGDCRDEVSTTMRSIATEAKKHWSGSGSAQ